MTWGEANKSDEPLLWRFILGVLKSLLVIVTLLAAAGQVILEILSELGD